MHHCTIENLQLLQHPSQEIWGPWSRLPQDTHPLVITIRTNTLHNYNERTRVANGYLIINFSPTLTEMEHSHNETYSTLPCLQAFITASTSASQNPSLLKLEWEPKPDPGGEVETGSRSM